MNKVLIILKRLKENFVRQRILLLSMIIQNVPLSLIVLIYANVIISNAKITGELDYFQVSLFYNVAVASLFIIICVFAPLLISRELNRLYTCNVIEHLLSVKIDISDIVYAIYIRGAVTLLILLISSFPIISISFYFGGFSMFRIIKLLLFMICYSALISAICVFISSRIFDANASIIVSYLIAIVVSIFTIFSLAGFLRSNLLYIFVIILCLIISFALLSMSRKTRIFCT